jgi:hypothetical protein
VNVIPLIEIQGTSEFVAVVATNRIRAVAKQRGAVLQKSFIDPAPE